MPHERLPAGPIFAMLGGGQSGGRRAMTDTIFTLDVKFEPYWWEAAPSPRETPPVLPAKADLAPYTKGP